MSKQINFKEFCKQHHLNPNQKASRTRYNVYTSNLSLDFASSDDDTDKANHGGKRAGAGRKLKHGKTIVKRVPERYEGAINELIRFLDESGSQIECLSEPLRMRLLDHRYIELSFNLLDTKVAIARESQE